MYLILLYKSGKFKKVKLEKMMEKDLSKVKYIMVPVNTLHSNQNYVVINAKYYKKFTKAIVSYRFCVSAEDADYINPYEFEFEPVYKEVDNIIDLFNLMNGIYTLTLVNLFINGNNGVSYSNELFNVRIVNFNVTLYNGDLKTCEYYYVLKPSSSTFYNPTKICNAFSGLYEIEDFLTDDKNSVLFLHTNGVWSIENEFDIPNMEYGSGLVGVLSRTTFNIHIISLDEFHYLNKIYQYEATITMFYTSNTIIRSLENFIDHGLYNLIFTHLQNENDVLTTSYIRGVRGKNVKRKMSIILDLFSYIPFIYQFITVIFTELYGPTSTKDKNDDIQEFQMFFHVHMMEDIISEHENRREYQIGVLDNRILTLKDFLYLLEERGDC